MMGPVTRRGPWAAALALVSAVASAERVEPPRDAGTPARPSPPRAGSGCVGRWQGWGRGASGAPWSIDMVVTAESGARCGTIEYPSLGCGGHLVNCRRQGDTVTFTEVYTHNPGTCAPAGRIDAQCEGAVMDWAWTGWELVRSRLDRAR